MTLYPGESAQLEMRILVPDYKLMLAKNLMREDTNGEV